MDGVVSSTARVLVLAATTVAPSFFDISFVGRFSKKLYVGLPDLDARATIIKNGLKSTRHSLEAADFEAIASACVDDSGRDLDRMVQAVLAAAAEEALGRGSNPVIPPITRGNFDCYLVERRRRDEEFAAFAATPADVADAADDAMGSS